MMNRQKTMRKSRGGFLRVGNPLNRFKGLFTKKATATNTAAAPANNSRPPPTNTRRSNVRNTSPNTSNNARNHKEKLNKMHTYLNQLMKLETLIKDDMERIKDKEVKAIEKGYEMDFKNREFNNLKREEIEIKKSLKKLEEVLKEVGKEYTEENDKVDSMIETQKSYESEIKKVGEKLLKALKELDKAEIESFLQDRPAAYKEVVRDILGDDYNRKPESFVYPPKRWLDRTAKYYREPKPAAHTSYLRTCIQNSSRCREDIKGKIIEKRFANKTAAVYEKKARNTAAASTKKAANERSAALAKEREEYKRTQTLRDLKEEEDRLKKQLKETMEKLREEQARRRMGNLYNQI